MDFSALWLKEGREGVLVSSDMRELVSMMGFARGSCISGSLQQLVLEFPMLVGIQHPYY